MKVKTSLKTVRIKDIKNVTIADIVAFANSMGCDVSFSLVPLPSKKSKKKASK